MSPMSGLPGLPALGRRGFLVSAAVAGLGAMIAAHAARSGSTVTNAGALTADSKLRHLLRRAGFGAGPTELATYSGLDLSAAVDRLLNFEHVDNSALEQRLTKLGLDPTNRADLERWWTLRMIYTARPLEEKMTLFWHSLLTSAISKVGRPEPMLVQNNFFRANALGRFPDIVKGVSQDPAMMIWLDTASNRKGHPNENYARELMELFTLGIGNYTENDVQAGARAFTGWSLQGQPRLGKLQYRFLPGQHDDGEKTFLGQTGNFNGDDIVDIIVKQPASAYFITKKLFTFFAYPNPSDDVLKPLIATYTASDYSIKALLRAILTSDAFFGPQAYRALVKSPVEYVVGTARVLGLETDAKGLPYLMAQMGQEIFNPPNVAGWPGGASWLTSGTWLVRLNLANRIAAALDVGPVAKLLGGTVGPNSFDLKQLINGATTPNDIVDRLANLLLDAQIDSNQRQVLVDYLSPPTGGSLANAPGAWLDERLRGALYLTLAMPEFHLS